tara:strand:+ start:7 stop:1467 length:1461 start_codon:yes stop_codon:yes gene_type:complete
MELQQLEKAKKCFETVVKINPNYSDAYNNLGMTLISLSENDDAKKNLEKSIEINKKNFQAYLNLGLLYRNSEKIELAEELIIKSIEINPKFLPGHINLMQLYEKLNEDEKLNESINNAEINFKNSPIVKLYKGKFLYKKEKFPETINNLENINFKSSYLILEETRCSILAKSYDQLNKNEDAFQYFKKSNEMNFKIYEGKNNKNNFLNLISKRKKFFNNLLIKKWPTTKRGNKKKDPVFLIGFPRSGTTLLDTILRSHSSIKVMEELPILENIIIKLNKNTNGDFNKLRNINENLLSELRDCYYENRTKIIKEDDNNKIYIDKMPLNIIYVGEILRIFPNAKFILTLRHPCDCVLSSFMQSFKLNDAMANFLDLEDSANLYNNVMELWTKYLKSFSINYCSVKYENIVFNFEKTISSILEFLDLPWSDNVFDFQKTAKNRGLIHTPSYNQVVKPIYNKSVGRWKYYEKNMSDIVPILNPWIKKFNY